MKDSKILFLYIERPSDDWLLFLKEKLKIIQKAMKEPLKFLKDPKYAIVAREVIRDPSYDTIMISLDIRIPYNKNFKITKKYIRRISLKTFKEVSTKAYSEMNKR